MVILLVLVIIVLAAAWPDQLWEPFRAYDPKITPGLVIVLLTGFFSELSILRAAVRGDEKHGTRKALQWMGINAGAAALLGLPIGVFLYFSPFDSFGATGVIGGAVFAEVMGVSLIAGSLWSRYWGTKHSEGVWVFVILNLASMASVLVAGFIWHLLYDWLDARGVWRTLYGMLGLWK